MNLPLVGAALVVTGWIVEAVNTVYAQFADVAPEVAGRVGNVVEGPQSHQLVGLYHGAPSAKQ